MLWLLAWAAAAMSPALLPPRAFLNFGLRFTLGGLSWERNVYDPVPGPRKLSETRNVRALHEFSLDGE